MKRVHQEDIEIEIAKTKWMSQEAITQENVGIAIGLDLNPQGRPPIPDPGPGLGLDPDPDLTQENPKKRTTKPNSMSAESTQIPEKTN